jgi:transcriptional regulator with XRE-family HTH domain
VSVRDNEEIGRVIRELLGDTSQADLARAISMDPSALSRVISGKRSLDLSELGAIAEFFGISSEDLLLADDQVFALRGDGGDEEVSRAIGRCIELMDNYLLLEAAAK